MEVDINFENYILENMFSEPSTMYEGPFENVLMHQSTSFITSQEDPLLCSSNYEDGAPSSGRTLQGGLHLNEDSINLSPHFSSTEIFDNSYFPMPAVCRNSTSKRSCNISVSQESNYSQRPTYNNDYFLPVAESNSDLNPIELDFFASSNFNSVNDLFSEPSWSTNQCQSESSNNLSTPSSSFQDVSQTYPISSADSSLSTSRETSPYSTFPLPVIDSNLLLITEPSSNSSNFQEDFSQTFSSSVAADSLLSTSIESSTNSTLVNCSPTRINVSSPDPVTVPISQPNSYSSPPQTTTTVDLQNSLSKTSVLQTPPYSPLNQGVSDFELNSIIDTLGSCVETSKFYELANIENAIASFYEFHVKKNIANCVDEIKKEDENLSVEDYGQINNEEPMLPSMLNINNDKSNVLQAFPEDECYLPETPGFSDEDGAMSPSQNILCLTPPPQPPSPVIDPVLLKLQRSVATVDFDHNYFLKNGQSRRDFYASTTSPPTYPTTPTSSAQVKRQLKNAIYDKTAQKRKVGRPPKSVNKNSNSTNVNRTSEEPIKTFGRVTFGKPEAYTRRMREEHDEKIKMSSTSATASSSKTKNCSARRRRTTASDPQDDMERRVNHNTMERTRRDFIKQSFETLRSLVPDLKGNPKASKAQILKKAREYIERYDDEFDRLKEANDREKRRNSELRLKLQKLRAESSSY